MEEVCGANSTPKMAGTPEAGQDGSGMGAVAARGHLADPTPGRESKRLCPFFRPKADHRIDRGACVTEPPDAPGLSGELVARARAGDHEALRTLTEHAYPLVRRWALVRTGDPAEADDLTQDVLVQMIRRLGAYRGDSLFTTWLYAVTRNAAADRFRRDRRRAAAHDDLLVSGALVPRPAPRPDLAADQRLLAAVIRSFYEELPARQREVFDLSELQGLSSTEVSARLGIAPVSVRAHLFKARRALRARILSDHPELAEEWA